MKTLRKSLPSVRTIAVVVSVFFVTAELLGGTWSLVLTFLALAAVFIAGLTLRNSDPDKFEAYHEPKAYAYRTERDRLYRSLTELVEAIEQDPELRKQYQLAAQAELARKLLTELNGNRQKPCHKS